MMNSDGEFIGPVNIGNPGEFTMLALAEAVIEMCIRDRSLTSRFPRYSRRHRRRAVAR